MSSGKSQKSWKRILNQESGLVEHHALYLKLSSPGEKSETLIYSPLPYQVPAMCQTLFWTLVVTKADGNLALIHLISQWISITI